ncbi:MAG: outer membrane protein assembly factor BamE [Sulfurovum sp.]|nr:outer membrane protein assembly factor BamE [Sulfurovum sp.]
MVISIFLSGCGSITNNSLNLEPGMSKQQVKTMLGTPDTRSFRGSGEAWQYSEVVGYGQCSYMTAWFSNSRLTSLTSRKGSSIAGCGLGSREVDWGQMPKASLDLNIRHGQI